MITSLVLLHLCAVLNLSEALCGDSIKWSHNINIEHVYGRWYGVGYAKHTPDYASKPEDIGCVTLYISDADHIHDEWLDWTRPHSNYINEDHNWLSRGNNRWSDTPFYGSWFHSRIRYKRHTKLNSSPSSGEINRRHKRDMYGERRLKVIWDEDGESVEQTYLYSKDDPGVWTVEKWRPMEREIMVRGIDVWLPDEPPRHPEAIRVLKLTTDQLIINHCADAGGGGIFTLILQRSPKKVGYWEWYELQKQFYSFDLPYVHRKVAVCAALLPALSGMVLLSCVAVWRIL